MQGVGIVGNAVGNAIGNAIGEALFGPPPGSPEDVQAQQAAAAQAAQAAAAAAQAAAAEKRRTDAIRAHLLSHMVTFDSPASPPGSAPSGAAGGDGLITIGGVPQMAIVTAPGQTAAFGKAGVPVDVACKTAINCSPGSDQATAAASAPPRVAGDGPLRDAMAGSPATGRSDALPPPIGLAGWTPRLLRSATEPDGHRLRGPQLAAACRQIAGEIGHVERLGAFAGMAGDAYDRYDPNNLARSVSDSFGALRISDDRAKMRELLPGVSDATLQKLLAPAGSGYRAAIYRDPNDPKQIYLVFRGTTNLDLKDWLADLAQETGHPTEYFANAIWLAKLLKKSAAAKGLKLTIIGHSLGGGMADAAGAVTHTTTISFNPEGVHPNTLPKGFDLASAKRYVTDVVVDGEPLNFAQDHREAVKAAYAKLLSDHPTAAAKAAAALQDMSGDQRVASELLHDGLKPDSLAPALGRRITLEADPRDLSDSQLEAIETARISLTSLGGALHDSHLSLSGWVRLHTMRGVMDALAHALDELHARSSQLGCAGR